MITLDRDTRLEKVQESESLRRQTSRTVLLGETVSATTPWLAAALSSLYRLQDAGGIEPGVGDLRVQASTADCAGRVLGSIRLLWLPVPEVGHISGGGVAFRWSIQENAVEVLVFPDSQVLVSEVEAGETTEPVELEQHELAQLNGILKKLIAA